MYHDTLETDTSFCFLRLIRLFKWCKKNNTKRKLMLTINPCAEKNSVYQGMDTNHISFYVDE